MTKSCELCDAHEITEWFYHDTECWIAECEMCGVPMVVWRTHDPNPSDSVRSALHDQLRAVTAEFYDYEPWIDDNMRSIPDHYHAHARPRDAFYGHGRRRRDGPQLAE